MTFQRASVVGVDEPPDGRPWPPASRPWRGAFVEFCADFGPSCPRAGQNATGFAYTDPDGATGPDIQTTVTDAQTHATVTRMDGYRRPTQLTNPKSKATKLTWDGDHNVTRLEEPNTAATTWTYDPKTGYPLTLTDAQAVADGTPAPS